MRFVIEMLLVVLIEMFANDGLHNFVKKVNNFFLCFFHFSTVFAFLKRQSHKFLNRKMRQQQQPPTQEEKFYSLQTFRKQEIFEVFKIFSFREDFVEICTILASRKVSLNRHIYARVEAAY